MRVHHSGIFATGAGATASTELLFIQGNVSLFACIFLQAGAAHRAPDAMRMKKCQ
jgi:hypothetical protein